MPLVQILTPARPRGRLQVSMHEIGVRGSLMTPGVNPNWNSAGAPGQIFPNSKHPGKPVGSYTPLLPGCP